MSFAYRLCGWNQAQSHLIGFINDSSSIHLVTFWPVRCFSTFSAVWITVSPHIQSLLLQLLGAWIKLSRFVHSCLWSTCHLYTAPWNDSSCVLVCGASAVPTQRLGMPRFCSCPRDTVYCLCSAWSVSFRPNIYFIVTLMGKYDHVPELPFHHGYRAYSLLSINYEEGNGLDDGDLPTAVTWRFNLGCSHSPPATPRLNAK